MDTRHDNWAVIVPMANEERDFAAFAAALREALDGIGSGHAYLVVDRVSTDRTLDLCRALAREDPRVTTVWAPENRNVVEAYLRGYREAFAAGHGIIIELDAGMSHDPAALPMFLETFAAGHECVFGSRFLPGGSMGDSPLLRRLLSRGGTIVSNLVLGTRFADMTSGYQGFRAHVVEKLIATPLRSRAHFYQTEVRYLLRDTNWAEVPIRYRAPSPRVRLSAIGNAVAVLTYYAWRRWTGRAAVIA